MRTLQNNFTTPEQSKRLLELGVPADSADCYYNIIPDRNSELIIRQTLDCELKNNFFTAYNEGDLIPCWSVGRLIEIVLKTPGFPYLCSEPTISLTNHNINRIIDLIIETIEVNLDVVDFSKLEDNYEHTRNI